MTPIEEGIRGSAAVAVAPSTAPAAWRANTWACFGDEGIPRNKFLPVTHRRRYNEAANPPARRRSHVPPASRPLGAAFRAAHRLRGPGGDARARRPGGR